MRIFRLFIFALFLVPKLNAQVIIISTLYSTDRACVPFVICKDSVDSIKVNELFTEYYDVYRRGQLESCFDRKEINIFPIITLSNTEFNLLDSLLFLNNTNDTSISEIYIASFIDDNQIKYRYSLRPRYLDYNPPEEYSSIKLLKEILSALISNKVNEAMTKRLKDLIDVYNSNR